MKARRAASDRYTREFRLYGHVVKRVRERELLARMVEHREPDGMLIKLLRRLGGYYDHIEPSDRAEALERTYQYVQE